MSQTEAPTESKKRKPVEAQEDSVGEKLHEVALRDETPNREMIKEAVKEAIKDEFDVVLKPRETVHFVIDCPSSGQKFLMKHLDSIDLMRAGLIEELDYFTKNLFPREFDDQGAPVEQERSNTEQGIWDILKNAEKRYRFLEMTNRLMAVSTIKPKIINDGVALRENEQGEKEDIFGYEVKEIAQQVELFGGPVPELQPGQAYAGYVDFTDRMMILTELNKPLRLIEPFRQGSDDVLENLESGESA